MKQYAYLFMQELICIICYNYECVGSPICILILILHNISGMYFGDLLHCKSLGKITTRENKWMWLDTYV